MYNGSTSTPLSYSIEAVPSVTVSGLPAKVSGGNPTYQDFTVTITNPFDGANFTHAFLTVSVGGLYKVNQSLVGLQYKLNSSTTWCTMIAVKTSGTVLYENFAGAGSSSAITYPASFASAVNSSMTVHLRANFPATATYPTTALYGVATIAARLYTGQCTSSVTCTATAPLIGTVAPSGKATVAVVPTSPFATKGELSNGRQSQTTFRQTFDVVARSVFAPTKSSTTGTYYLGAPRGTVSYAIDGTTVGADNPLVSFAATESYDNSIYLSTSSLSVGSHELVATFSPATYTGTAIFQSSSYSVHFTVVAAPSGTPFTCTLAGAANAKLMAYVTASTPPATVPGSGTGGSNATVSNNRRKARCQPECWGCLL